MPATLNSRFTRALCVAVLSLLGSSAHAMIVTFSDFLDDGLATGYDLSANVIAGNTLTLGLNSFEASSTTVGSPAIIGDTVTFNITAPAGFFIKKVSYEESGDGDTPNGVAISSGALIADSIPKNFPSVVFTPTAGGGWMINTFVDIADKTQIAVAVVNNLMAVDLGEDASISKTFAEITVEVQAIPLPPALGLLGMALVGVLTIGARRAGGGEVA